MKKKQEKKLWSRLDRIERKCDRLLSELIIIRQNTDIDKAIDRMHRAARRMRVEADRERDNAIRRSNPYRLE
ncbi:MAG: hypothetical protein K2M69_02085 [Muribaculaceae bacterium]|nr:hypothetical protein [Muribaculaceae bacterium]